MIEIKKKEKSTKNITSPTVNTRRSSRSKANKENIPKESTESVLATGIPTKIKNSKDNKAAEIKTSNPRKTVLSDRSTTSAKRTVSRGGKHRQDSVNKKNKETEQQIESSKKHPALELIADVVEKAYAAGKDYHNAMLYQSYKILEQCESILTEAMSIVEFREPSKRWRKDNSRKSSRHVCACQTALEMMPILDESGKSKSFDLDHVTEDSTDKFLSKLASAIENIRLNTKKLQGLSAESEAKLIKRVRVSQAHLNCIESAYPIVKNPGHPNTVSEYLDSQKERLERWYQLYPRPSVDEQMTMHQILTMVPLIEAHKKAQEVTINNVRVWFDRRRGRERLEHVRKSISSAKGKGVCGTDLKKVQQSAGDEIRQAIEDRIKILNSDETNKDHDIFEEFDKLKKECQAIQDNLSGVSASTVITSPASKPVETNVSLSSLSKKRRSEVLDMDYFQDDIVVEPLKSMGKLEIIVVQKRLRSILGSKFSHRTRNIESVLNLLSSVHLPSQYIRETAFLDDLKDILHIFRNDPALRKKVNVLIKKLEHSLINQDNDSSFLRSKLDDGFCKNSGRKRIKFTISQVKALEERFQAENRPSIPSLKVLLEHLNTDPLVDMKKQASKLNISQIRRWFNKRRCLRKPPQSVVNEYPGNQEKASVTADEEKTETEEDTSEVDGDTSSKTSPSDNETPSAVSDNEASVRDSVLFPVISMEMHSSSSDSSSPSSDETE